MILWGNSQKPAVCPPRSHPSPQPSAVPRSSSLFGGVRAPPHPHSRRGLRCPGSAGSASAAEPPPLPRPGPLTPPACPPSGPPPASPWISVAVPGCPWVSLGVPAHLPAPEDGRGRSAQAALPGRGRGRPEAAAGRGKGRGRAGDIQRVLRLPGGSGASRGLLRFPGGSGRDPGTARALLPAGVAAAEPEHRWWSSPGLRAGSHAWRKRGIL